MKKLFVIISVICALTLGSAVVTNSYAYVPESCSYVSGANVESYFHSGSLCVKLENYSGARCSASYKVYGRTENGNWEEIASGILTAGHGKTDIDCVPYESMGYTTARLGDVSTWKCD